GGYCPACLREDGGRWQLVWRLPWAFACPRHHRLLADTCPACRRRTHPDRPGHRGEPHQPGTCTTPVVQRNRGVHTPACAYPLTDVITTAIPPDGLTQHSLRHIGELIDPGVADDRQANHRPRRRLDHRFRLAPRALPAP